MNTRKRRLTNNTISSITFQICTIICGFIIPRLILQSFGSEVNGLVNSIAQFLGVIAFLELGVGAVVQSALYKPLADTNAPEISKIFVSAQKFFHLLACILLIYIIVLICFYPLITKQYFSFIYTATLIAAIGASSLAQYYFGISYMLLLTADQRGYISYNAQTFTLLLNTFSCYVLIRTGASIQIVKLATSLIYLLRPAILVWYVNQHYRLDKTIKYDKEPIQQKWNGVAQHIAAVVLDSTDLIVLTVFASLSTVSVYSIYFLVINGVKHLLLSMTNGIQALLGELWARQELWELENMFSWVEWTIHTVTTYIFGCTAILILPFISVYTRGINDANYIQPLFAILITAANAGHCYRLPYNLMILAGGHYKQTQSNYIIAAIVNVVISVLLVTRYGLIGVAIGTLVAMLYQTFWMAIYISKNLIKWPLANFTKQIFIDMVSVILMYIFTMWFSLDTVTYFAWFIMAIKVVSASAIAVLIVNIIFYRNMITQILRAI